MALRRPDIRYGRRYGSPPRLPQSLWRRLLRHILNPVVYLKLVMILAGSGLIVLPYGADVITAALKPVASADGNCRVLVVIDGDTIKLVCPDRGVGTARLLGFDAPEKFAPRCMAELVAAERATWGLRGLIFGAKALAVVHDGTDRYGRALVRLTLDGQDVARSMIRAGYGRTYSGGLRGSWC